MVVAAADSDHIPAAQLHGLDEIQVPLRIIVARNLAARFRIGNEGMVTIAASGNCSTNHIQPAIWSHALHTRAE